MRVLEIDPLTAPVELLQLLYRVEEATSRELIPGEPPRSVDEALAWFRNPPSREVRRFWAAEDGDEVVGWAGLYVYGPAFVGANVDVLPTHRRRGIGTSLLAALRTAAREAKVGSFFAHYGTEAGEGFAARVGAVADQRDVRSALRLREADLPEPSVPEGYELRSWIGCSPDELVESFAIARGAMDDAPTPGGAEAPAWDVGGVRRSEETAIRRGREVRVSVALDPAGQIVAFSDVRVPGTPVPGTAARVDDTGTVAQARGRGLARAVKLESLRRLRDDRPDVELVLTMNAEQNAAMLHINAQIGFVPTATLTTAVLKL